MKIKYLNDKGKEVIEETCGITIDGKFMLVPNGETVKKIPMDKLVIVEEKRK